MFFDIVFVLYIVLNAFMGFRFGLFRRAIHVGAFYLGMLLAQALSPGFSEQFGYSSGSSPSSAHFGVFLTIVFGMVIVAEALSFAYADALAFLNTMLADRLLGSVLGATAAVLELAVILYLFAQMVATPLPTGSSLAPIVTSSQDQIRASILTPQIHKAQRLSLFLFRPVLPPEPGTYFRKTYS